MQHAGRPARIQKPEARKAGGGARHPPPRHVRRREHGARLVEGPRQPDKGGGGGARERERGQRLRGAQGGGITLQLAKRDGRANPLTELKRRGSRMLGSAAAAAAETAAVSVGGNVITISVIVCISRRTGSPLINSNSSNGSGGSGGNHFNRF